MATNRYSTNHVPTTPDTTGNKVLNALRGAAYKARNDWEFAGELAKINDANLTDIRKAHLAKIRRG